MGFMGQGHSGAAVAIIAMVFSSAFLVWVGSRTSGQYLKIGKLLGLIAVLVSFLLVIGSLVMCFSSYCLRCGFMGGKGMMPYGHGAWMMPETGGQGETPKPQK